MEKIAVFPGTFDPITNGHIEIIERGKAIFDKIIIGIGVNSQKKTMFSLEKRLEWIKDLFQGDDRVEVQHFTGLTVHFCKEVGADFLLRGLRNTEDLNYERTIAQLNQIIGDNIETVFLISQPQYSHISSTIVREIIKGGGDASSLLPEGIDPYASWQK